MADIGTITFLEYDASNDMYNEMRIVGDEITRTGTTYAGDTVHLRPYFRNYRYEVFSTYKHNEEAQRADILTRIVQAVPNHAANLRVVVGNMEFNYKDTIHSGDRPPYSISVTLQASLASINNEK